jgi:hypothetical protein
MSGEKGCQHAQLAAEQEIGQCAREGRMVQKTPFRVSALLVSSKNSSLFEIYKTFFPYSIHLTLAATLNNRNMVFLGAVGVFAIIGFKLTAVTLAFRWIAQY